MQKVIFFGNGPLADFALEILRPHVDIIFHARTRADLDTVRSIKVEHPEAYGILASYGVLIKSDILDLFEPVGILNLHPSLLPAYRGPSPIETAILNGDTTFGVSIMKLAPAMDAGPIYYQTALDFALDVPKSTIYQALAQTGAKWLVAHLGSLPSPQPQDDARATYCQLLTTAMSPLDSKRHSAMQLANQVRAFQKFPKSKLTLFGQDCIILEAHPAPELPAGTTSVSFDDIVISYTKKKLFLHCLPQANAHETYLEIITLQPAGKKPMPVSAFLNGYVKNT